MGCSSSTADVKRGGYSNGKLPEPSAPPPPDPRLPLTARQKFSLEKSWKAVQRNMEEVGMNTLLRLFKEDPSIQDLFPSFKGQTEHQLRNDMGFENQAVMILNIFDEVVEQLNNLDAAISLLTKTGKKHSMIDPDMMMKFEKPFLETVKETLEDRYNEKIEAIYITFTKFVLDHVITGMKGT
ncbi:myoglobin-like [Strongylocentrotus purpuratus]|uniref:Globin domain-containing protein n=1 Tax=Strongylocentrotus purpuratus TaxID=7668 RepID=A0A7M7T5C6_STRPU|nr:myoglobin-like [Strongylocentrotus purpuratus]